jgi:hypothetical protein
MSSVTVVRYSPELKRSWDAFVETSKNGVFLFKRDYMEYHADRFPDHSLLFFNEEERLLGLLPATFRDDACVSHAGLTFGGVISDAQMKVGLMLEVFSALGAYLRGQGIERLIYKAVPHIYHRLPAEEDLYALFRCDARLYRRDVASTIFLKERLPFSKGRKYAAKVGQKHALEVTQSHDYQTFMSLEKELLDTKYGAKPVHTHEELGLLAGRFPENIKLFAAFKEKQMLAGVVIYESSQVAHTQYIGANDEGKRCGALDLIMTYLINDYYAEKPHFDFGISTEAEGRELNNGLIENKQSYGARAIVYDFYEIDLSH